jgi:hypothetical protein
MGGYRLVINRFQHHRNSYLFEKELD